MFNNLLTVWLSIAMMIRGKKLLICKLREYNIIIVQ